LYEGLMEFSPEFKEEGPTPGGDGPSGGAVRKGQRLPHSMFTSADLCASKNKAGYTALIHAAIKGDTEKVEELISSSASINHQENDGNTALIWASRWGNIGAVLALIRAGAKVNIQNANKETALTKAAFYGHKQVVKALVEANADPSICDIHGYSPVLWSTQKDHAATEPAENDYVHVMYGLHVDLMQNERLTGKWKEEVFGQEGSPKLLGWRAEDSQTIKVYFNKSVDDDAASNLAKQMSNVMDHLFSHTTNDRTRELLSNAIKDLRFEVDSMYSRWSEFYKLR